MASSSSLQTLVVRTAPLPGFVPSTAAPLPSSSLSSSSSSSMAGQSLTAAAAAAAGDVVVEIAASASLRDVKQRIAQTHPLRPPVDAQRLVYAGRVWTDSATVRDMLQSPLALHLKAQHSQPMLVVHLILPASIANQHHHNHHNQHHHQQQKPTPTPQSSTNPANLPLPLRADTSTDTTIQAQAPPHDATTPSRNTLHDAIAAAHLPNAHAAMYSHALLIQQQQQNLMLQHQLQQMQAIYMQTMMPPFASPFVMSPLHAAPPPALVDPALFPQPFMQAPHYPFNPVEEPLVAPEPIDPAVAEAMAEEEQIVRDAEIAAALEDEMEPREGPLSLLIKLVIVGYILTQNASFYKKAAVLIIAILIFIVQSGLLRRRPQPQRRQQPPHPPAQAAPVAAGGGGAGSAAANVPAGDTPDAANAVPAAPVMPQSTTSFTAPLGGASPISVCLFAVC
ncbi:hypothetical protein CAOG_02854 [Capsaspora owczarzaki ATCC 30864]|uniref:Ubiquitin-like domain-containing protein n=1 Tax=Capsaspora owczarzaki (strain ATCC 30864) TaxID=595528 RepID=A0A0D2WN57_CAPO3|nr:hypothetical protein CAOG_02854 [Capsaspora owczarzaki ATCC 30864]KJE91763.1 hypothetical protein CAOG_002854 [Capsaspora owczarzaki ATCC 30864]KJE91764.1 hypothetical protein, variant [Capsaspora owczarzaki ATCC 30864]|eukprot:XP_004363693.2 hypothetical protein CAOG_02854 [Capsaspora owczarzaki ATCC 30864]